MTARFSTTFFAIVIFLVTSCNNKDSSTAREFTNVESNISHTKNNNLDQNIIDIQALAALKSIHGNSLLDRDYVINSFSFKTPAGRLQLAQQLNSSNLNLKEQETVLLNLVSSLETSQNSCQEWQELQPILAPLHQTELSNTLLLGDYALHCNNDANASAIIDFLLKDLFARVEFETPGFQKLFIKAYWHAYEKLLMKENFPLQKELNLDFHRGISEQHRQFYARMVKEIHARAYKIILSKHKLILPESRMQQEAPEFRPIEWTVNYNVGLGRCSGASKSLTTQGVEDSYGQQCNYSGGDSNSTLVQLGYSLQTQPIGSIQRIAAAVHSNLHGGYADRGDENQTASLNYTVRGTGVIPKCNNPLICWPLVKVVRVTRENALSFNGIAKSDPRNSSYKINIGGQSLNEGESVWIDRSQADVVIEITMQRSDVHVGACCDPGAGQQQISLDIIGLKEPGPVMMANLLELNYQIHTRGMSQYSIPGIGNSASFFSNALLQVSERDFDFLGIERGIPEDLLTRTNTRLDFMIHAGKDWNVMLDTNSLNKQFDLNVRYVAYYGAINLINWLFANRAQEISSEEANYLQLFKQSLSNHARQNAIHDIRQQLHQTREELASSAYKIVKDLYQKMEIAYEYQTNATADDVKKLADILANLSGSQVNEETLELARLATDLSSRGIEQRTYLLQTLKELASLLERLEQREQMLKGVLDLTTLELGQYAH
jgi:hypothetical protein